MIAKTRPHDGGRFQRDRLGELLGNVAASDDHDGAFEDENGAAPKVIVVVLVPGKANRAPSDEQMLAQLHRPFGRVGCENCSAAPFEVDASFQRDPRSPRSRPRGKGGAQR